MLVHLVLSAVPGSVLIRDWTEARALWGLVLTAPQLRAAVIMATHLHAAVPEHEVPMIKEAARRYALWRNHYRGERLARCSCALAAC